MLIDIQENNFQKLRNYFLKQFPEMTGMYLDMGAIEVPKVYIEHSYYRNETINRSRNGKIIPAHWVTDLTRHIVPEKLITAFKLALSEKV